MVTLWQVFLQTLILQGLFSCFLFSHSALCSLIKSLLVCSWQFIQHTPMQFNHKPCYSILISCDHFMHSWQKLMVFLKITLKMLFQKHVSGRQDNGSCKDSHILIPRTCDCYSAGQKCPRLVPDSAALQCVLVTYCCNSSQKRISSVEQFKPRRLQSSLLNPRLSHVLSKGVLSFKFIHTSADWFRKCASKLSHVDFTSLPNHCA